MFDKRNIPKYLIMLGIVLIASYIGKNYNHYIEGNDKKDEYKLIQEYLLNDSPLYGYNKPKMWIHTKYEYNSRNWKSFQSRSSTDLNQPYIHLTIKSIVLHCADDFNICLIDDDTFSKLIPSWDINMKYIAEPLKSQYRDYGMAQLIYFYGGIIVPNTFVCLRNLKELYIDGIQNGTPFICEYENKNINSTAGGQNCTFMGDPNYILNNNTKDGNVLGGLLENANRNLIIQSHNPTLNKERQRLLFLPNAFFWGAQKNDSTVLEMIEFLKIKDKRKLFSNESKILGNYSQWCLTKVIEGKMNLIDGEMIGIKTFKEKKPILIEDILSEGFLDINPNSYGVYISEEEILKRNKYQWFAVMSGENIINSRLAISKYLLESIVNYLPPEIILDDSNISNKKDIAKIKERTVFTI